MKLMDSKELADILVRNINEKFAEIINKLNSDLTTHNVQVGSTTFLGSEWNDMISNAVDTVVSNHIDFKYVSDVEPPHDVEILVKSPTGIIHLSHWRPSYNIFTCQDKSDSTDGWSWRTI